VIVHYLSEVAFAAQCLSTWHENATSFGLCAAFSRLNGGIADNNAIISKDSKIISGDLSQIQDLVSKGDLDGAAKIGDQLNKTAKESNEAQKKNDRYGQIKSDLQNQ